MRRSWLWLLPLFLLVISGPSWGQGQLINGNRTQAGANNYALTTGTGTAYVLTLNPALPGYVDGTCFLVRVHVANTGDASLNVNGKGATPLRKWSSGTAVPLVAGDLSAQQDVIACYDSSNGPRFQVLSLGGGTGGGGVTDGDKGDITVSSGGSAWTVDPGAITYSKLQDVSAPALLLGRGSSGAGPAQEIQLGVNCTMTGTVLNCAGGTGTVGISGSPTAGQAAEWTAPAVITGVATTGTGSYVKNTSPIVTTPFISGVNAQIGTTYTLVAADNQKLVTFTNAASVAVTLPQATVAGFTNGAVFHLRNLGVGTVVVTPTTSTIDGGSTLALMTNESVSVYSNGTNYATQRMVAGDRVNGVTYPNNPAVDTVPTVTATNTVSYRAIPDCDDTTGKHLNYDTTSHTWLCGNSTRTVPATKNHADLATLTVDSDTYNEVRVDELTSATVNLDAPTGSPFDGQRLRYSITSTVSRALTYTTTSGGFAAEAGQNFPAKTVAGSYLIMEFRWSGKSSHWALESVSWRLPKVASFGDVATIQINANVTELAAVALGSATQTNYTIKNPTGTLFDGQILRVRFTTSVGAAAKPLIWESMFTGNAGTPLPTVTTGNGTQDVFGFSYNAADNTLVMLATTQNSLSARRRTCMMMFGGTTGPNLADADLVELEYCSIPTAAVIEEIEISAISTGTPSIMVHQRSGGTNTPLLSSALATAASGGFACARPTAVAGFRGYTCQAKLQNVSTTGEVDLGTTSGTASTSTPKVLIRVHYLLAS